MQAAFGIPPFQISSALCDVLADAVAGPCVFYNPVRPILGNEVINHSGPFS